MEPEAQQFDEKITNIKSSFFSALDDFKKYYVFYNKNPEVSEYQNYYVNSKSQLQGLGRDLFLLTNDIQKNMQQLDSDIQVISLRLEDEKTLNGELLQLLTNLENTQSGSEIMISDSKNLYNNQYYLNIELILGIIIASVLLATLFKSKAVVLPIK
jgi:hypothetical protein